MSMSKVCDGCLANMSAQEAHACLIGDFTLLVFSGEWINDARFDPASSAASQSYEPTQPFQEYETNADDLEEFSPPEQSSPSSPKKRSREEDGGAGTGDFSFLTYQAPVSDELPSPIQGRFSESASKRRRTLSITCGECEGCKREWPSQFSHACCSFGAPQTPPVKLSLDTELRLVYQRYADALII